MEIYVLEIANQSVCSTIRSITYVLDVTLHAVNVSDLRMNSVLNVQMVSFKLTNTRVILSVSQRIHILLTRPCVSVRVIFQILKIPDIACNRNCKSCYGPEITECTDCYPPYSLIKEDNECIFNYTLAEIYNTKYRPVSLNRLYTTH